MDCNAVAEEVVATLRPQADAKVPGPQPHAPGRIAEGDTETADRFLEAIAEQAEISAKMVDALLALARAGDAKLRKELVDMNGLVRDVVESMRRAGAAGPLPVVEPLQTVDADPALARQVFVNLIGNAAKFSSGVSQPRIEVGITGSPERPVFFVRDNGVGFDAEKAHRLFKPFQRLHGMRYEGSGVGLSIVKRIIDRHGGRIWAESRPAHGATFFFSFDAAARSAVDG